jgi:hypothetical protein
MTWAFFIFFLSVTNKKDCAERLIICPMQRNLCVLGSYIIENSRLRSAKNKESY